MRNASLKMLVCVMLAMLASGPAAAYDWLQFNGNAQHDGNNTVETGLTRNNVGRLIRKYVASVGGTSDHSPVFLQDVTTTGGVVRDLLFVTTTAGSTMAIDASTGANVWTKSYPANGCTNPIAGTCFTTSTPAIDPNRNFVYAYGLDGSVHKLAAGTGAETMSAPWPITLSKKPENEKSASAIGFAQRGGKTYLYVVHGGYPGDCCDYQGHVTTIELAGGTEKIFNTNCSDIKSHIDDGGCGTTQNAVWSRPGVVYDAATDHIYFATGNGNWNGSTNWSESILKINADGSSPTMGPVDSYTPTNHGGLDGGDTDVGSTGPVILVSPRGAAHPHIAAQSGKDGKLRLVDLDDLSQQGAPGNVGGELAAIIDVPQGGGVFGQPATWVDHANETTWLFVGNGNGLSALKLALNGSHNPSLALGWQTGSSAGGHSPLVANNVLFSQRGGIRAYDPVKATLLWSTSRIGGQHWQSPIVANGVLYAVDSDGNVSAFANSDAGMRVDQHSGSTTSNLNGILEPGETVIVEPALRNVTAAPLTALTGTAGTLTGPAGATYTVGDGSAGYGTIAAGAVGDCFIATGNCYRVSVSAPVTRPAVHWDLQLHETLSSGDTTTLTLHVGHSFPDVPDTHLMYAFIEALVHNNVVLGFSNGTFQPDATATRGATAIMVARVVVAPNGETAIAPTGKVDAAAFDCGAGGVSLFDDLPATNVECKHVHALAAQHVDVSFDCGSATSACPADATTREVMAVLVAGAMAGADASVPSSGTFSDSGAARSYDCGGGGSSHFPDVAAASPSCRHINYLWARGVIDGYNDGTFLPQGLVLRSQIAKFLTNAFDLRVY